MLLECPEPDGLMSMRMVPDCQTAVQAHSKAANCSAPWVHVCGELPPQEPQADWLSVVLCVAVHRLCHGGAPPPCWSVRPGVCELLACAACACSVAVRFNCYSWTIMAARSGRWGPACLSGCMPCVSLAVPASGSAKFNINRPYHMAASICIDFV